MADRAEIDALLARHGLCCLGAVTVTKPKDILAPGTRMLLLIGPDNARFWPHFTRSPEYLARGSDPLDDWSRRVLGALAEQIGAQAILPSDGPPYPPFYQWSLASGAFFAAPINLLVHPKDGLMTSLRGALALPFEVETPPPGPNPCITCAERPCLSACPVSAFKGGRYDVARCHNHLDTSAGSDCMVRGCAARRACPASEGSGRLPEQSAFHMRAFHGKR